MGTSSSQGPFLQEVCEQLIAEEGSIPHMYCDSRGYVTVGVGRMLATAEDAAKLPFIHADTAQAASQQEIVEDYNRVKSEYSADANWGAKHYNNVAKLILSKDSINQLLLENVTGFEQGLLSSLPDFEQYPNPVKLALLDMAFNLGLNKLLNSYPKLMGAIKAQDWAACAQECHRRGISEARNEETAQRFAEASSDTTNLA